jgi:hypothetical protein
VRALQWRVNMSFHFPPYLQNNVHFENRWPLYSRNIVFPTQEYSKIKSRKVCITWIAVYFTRRKFTISYLSPTCQEAEIVQTGEILSKTMYQLDTIAIDQSTAPEWQGQRFDPWRGLIVILLQLLLVSISIYKTFNIYIKLFLNIFLLV